MVSHELSPEYYGMPYRIRTDKPSFSQLLTPVKVESFDTYPSVFEQRKVGWLKIILSVSPSTPRK